jgi:hypothetical protein
VLEDMCLFQHSLLDSRVSGRNLHSVLDSMASGRACPVPPTVALSETPIVIRQSSNTYHCDGILPWNDRKVFLISPSMFSPTKWVQRKLTNRELLNILDVPDSIISALSDRNHATLISDTAFLPLKVILQLINMVPIESISRLAEAPCK